MGWPEMSAPLPRQVRAFRSARGASWQARRRRGNFAPKQPDFAKIYDFSRATEGCWVRHRDMYWDFWIWPHIKKFTHPAWAVRKICECVRVEISVQNIRKSESPPHFCPEMLVLAEKTSFEREAEVNNSKVFKISKRLLGINEDGDKVRRMGVVLILFKIKGSFLLLSFTCILGIEF